MKQISFLLLAALLGAVQANAGSILTDPDLDSTIVIYNGTPDIKNIYLREGNTLSAWEFYYWRPQTNDWGRSNKMIYEYEDGRLAKVSSLYRWNTTQNAYEEDPSWKSEYYYNEQGKEWYKAHYNWDWSQKEWEAEPSTRTEYQYDETGKLVFTYSPDATTPTSKTEYQYDAQGYLIKEIAYKLANDNTWAKSSEYIYQNNSEGKATSYEYHCGQILGPTIIGGIVTIPAFGYWGLYGWGRSEYDASGRIKRKVFDQIIYEVTSINTVSNTGRTDTESTTYYYRNESSALTLPASNAVTVYSDPAADRLTLSGLQGNETLRIYSISGNLLLSDTATGETTLIDVAHLPAGIYLVGIQSDKGVSTHKFIKQ
jgi:hypothetical protein